MEKKSHKSSRAGNNAGAAANTSSNATMPLSTQQQSQMSAKLVALPHHVSHVGSSGSASASTKQRSSNLHRHHSHHHSSNQHHSSSHHQQAREQHHGQYHTTQAHGTHASTPAFTVAVNKSAHHSTKLHSGTKVGHNTNAIQVSPMNAVSTKTPGTLRNKNEEAIKDLCQRIPEIDNIFDVHSRIGNGTFSTVLLGTLKREREMPESMRRKFAIKHHIPTSHPDRIMKELQCMAKMGGTDNVVGINCCIRYNESVAFIMPYMQHDRFHDFYNKMELAELQNYMKNLLIALRHVHKFNVIHRDVKPSNFLYNRRKRQFLLVDFGLAQHIVPTQQMTGAIESGCDGVFSVTDGKRPRDADDITGGYKISDPSAINVTSGDMLPGSKRFRSTGPQGDHDASHVNIPANARVANSCNVGGSPFKMPLKQLNEITGGCSVGGGVGTGGCGGGSASNGKAAVLGGAASATVTGSGNANMQNADEDKSEAQLGRQVKSAIIGSSINRNSQQKVRPNQIPPVGAPRNTGGADSAATGSSSIMPVGVDSNKYNTNRNLNSANAAKCVCYGNPQVCNICLIKKEIHASRAGTPGYRPPEVLLKYPDQTTAVDIWAAGVIFLSILSSVYPFFKAPNDFVALAEMVTIFGDKTIRKTAYKLDRLVTLSQKTKPLDLRKLCVRFRNRIKFSSPDLLKKYQQEDGSCEVCRNCDQFYFNCLCSDTSYHTEPLDDDDPFPASAYDLLYKLLEVNPLNRITAEEALKHPFFSETSNGRSDGNNRNNNTDMSTRAVEGVNTKKNSRGKIEP